VTDLVTLLSEDLNTPMALARLSEVSSRLQSTLVCEAQQADFQSLIESIDNMFGLNLMSIDDITQEQKQHISQREEARTSQNWAESDSIRDELLEQGIALRDTEHGTIWSKL
jgi:cysteinyl-tRNA synthetase